MLGMAVLPMMAQNITDAVRFSSKDVAGSARYRAMGGAFGALGGDVSSMGDNPAGTAVFRGTQSIVFTPSMAVSITSTDGSSKERESKADASFSNLGFVMSFKTNNSDVLTNFNIGMNIRHSEGLNRRYHTALSGASNSFADYLANRANNALLVEGRYGNPGYLETDGAWGNNLYPISTLLGYDSYAIDDHAIYNQFNKVDHYEGVSSGYLNDHGMPLVGYQQLFVKEKNRHDEYDFNMSFNFDDFIYAGVTMTVSDFSSIVNTEFDEDFGKGMYASAFNDLETKGSGVAVKVGMMARITDNWRVGAALHTPTWLRLTDYYSADMKTDASKNGNRSYSNTYDYKYRYYTPWEYQLSTAYVFGKKGILSFEYNLTDFTTAKFKKDKDDFGSWNTDVYADINDAIKNDFGAMQHTFKLGAEYRITKTASLRAGYVYRTTPYENHIFDNVSRSWRNGNFGDDNTLLFDSSTKPNYSLLDNQQIFSCGMGWRWSDWHLDISFQDRVMKEKVAAFPTTDAVMTANYDEGWVEFTRDPDFGAVKANYIDMLTNNLHFDVTIGMNF